jgi:hypothetical protein
LVRAQRDRAETAAIRLDGRRFPGFRIANSSSFESFVRLRGSHPTEVVMLKLVLFVLAGAVAGFAFQRTVGCRTGACLITSNPYVSTLYGALLGYLLHGTR